MFSRVWVTADDAHVYPAWADRSFRWNGWIGCPLFTLETVRQIAKDLRDDIASMGYADADEIRVIEPAPGPPPCAGAVRPVIVLHISWPHFDRDHPDECAEFVEAGKVDGIEGIDPHEDLYPVGACNWTWYETTPSAEGTPNA